MAGASVVAALPLFLLLLIFPLSALADFEPHSDGTLPKCRDDPALVQEVANLRSKFQDLEESSLEKDVVIHDKEKIISALRTELENLKKDESLLHDNELKEVGAKVTQLEEDLQKAQVELQESKSKAKSLEAAQSMQLSKLKQLEKLVSDQKKQIAEAEQTLRVAESTLLRVQSEADAKELELLKVHGGWLPPWTSIKLVGMKATAGDYWTRHCLPLVDTAMKKVSEKVSAAQTWSKPYVENLRTHAEQNWNPAFKRGAESMSATVSPYLVTAKSKAEQGYQNSKDFIIPQLQKIQSAVEPHLQVAKETCQPYVQEAAEALRPYYKQVQSVTKPYTDKVSQSYRKFLTSVRTYHSQLQVSIKGKLQRIELLEPLASNELIWFLSAALLVLPVIFIYTFLSSQLTPRKKPVKAAKGHHGGHNAHKKPRRAKHVDK